MFAPAHHAAVRHVGPSRVELATRTIFNLLGPMSNPASVKRQIIGVYAKQWVEPLAHVMNKLGSEAVWVTHGEGGLDEITANRHHLGSRTERRKGHDLRDRAGRCRRQASFA